MPFGEYKDFDDCVSKNQNKNDPEAYCAEIKRKIEEEGKSDGDNCPDKLRILKSDSRFIIYGPASVEIIDKEKDRIRASGLELALPQLLKRGRLSLKHQDLLVGDILPEFKSEGKIYKTGVFNNRLMVLGEIWDDTKAALETRQGIIDKRLRSYSISGEILKAQRVCNEGGCFRDISKLDLHAITICESGMNPAAHFEIIQKSDGIIEYKAIALHNLNAIKSEVLKTMNETSKSPIVELDKQESAPPVENNTGGGGGNDLADMKAMMAKMLAMMEQMMGQGGEIKAAAKVISPSEQPEVSKELADLKKKVSDQDELIKKINAGSITQTPRPEIAKSGLEDDRKINFGSIREIEYAYPRGMK